jgi:hypothetical protein
VEEERRVHDVVGLVVLEVGWAGGAMHADQVDEVGLDVFEEEALGAPVVSGRFVGVAEVFDVVVGDELGGAGLFTAAPEVEEARLARSVAVKGSAGIGQRELA